MSSAENPPSRSAARDVQAEFLPLAERDHGADDEHAARALVEMRARPHSPQA